MRTSMPLQNKKVYIICGSEFVSNKNRPALIVESIYGLKPSRAIFRDHLAVSLHDIGFKSCLADPDVWMISGIKSDSFEYWENCLCYVDDLLVISREPHKVMGKVSDNYTLEEGIVKEPDLYLGARFSNTQISGLHDLSKTRWAMSSDNYVNSAIANLEKEINKIDSRLPIKVETHLSSGYKPELGSSKEFTPGQVNLYQGIICTLIWICELGRVDILMPVYLLSSYLCRPGLVT